MSDTSDLDRQIEQLKRCEIIMEAEVKALCAKAREILVEESNVQRVDSPVTVINLSRIFTIVRRSTLIIKPLFGIYWINVLTINSNQWLVAVVEQFP